MTSELYHDPPDLSIQGDKQTVEQVQSERKPAYYAIIPASVRYDDSIPANAKLLYGEISALADDTGYCYASNQYFANLYKVSERAISGWISALKKGKYIAVYVKKARNGQIQQRKIFLETAVRVSAEDGQPVENIFHTPRKNLPDGVEEIFVENNASNNNIPPSPPRGCRPSGKQRQSRSQYKAQADVLPDRFNKFWDFYRTHIPVDCNAGNRQKAIRAWDKLAPSDNLVTQMAAALAVQVKSQTWLSGIGVPHASTWLNNHGWEDDWGPAAESRIDSSKVPDSEENAEWVL